jgi:uncharacterized membrane protein (UPF0127 family)
MNYCKVYCNDVLIAEEIRQANHFFVKLIGLLNDKKIDGQQGLLLFKCKQIHTIGMNFPIDVVFISKEGIILYIENDFAKGKISHYIKNSYYALELKANVASFYALKIGDTIQFDNDV